MCNRQMHIHNTQMTFICFFKEKNVPSNCMHSFSFFSYVILKKKDLGLLTNKNIYKINYGNIP